MINHPMLPPNMTDADIRHGLEICQKDGFASACMHPYQVPRTAKEVEATGVLVYPLIGFPHENRAIAIEAADNATGLSRMSDNVRITDSGRLPELRPS